VLPCFGSLQTTRQQLLPLRRLLLHPSYHCCCCCCCCLPAAPVACGQALFRPITVVVPDRQLIMENMLMAEGFVTGELAAHMLPCLAACLP
jgi:hypothetical protein